ncbi:MAG: glucose-6-phosphate dehydrogenase assembly protein OpcA [Streptosporangiaceae bacterium]
MTGLTDTSASEINAALTRARHRSGGFAVGMVLTMIVVSDERDHAHAVSSAAEAARQHPCRIITTIPRGGKGRSRLDAEVGSGDDTGPGETVVLRLYGPLSRHAESVVTPLLLPDTPAVTWWPATAPAIPADDALGAVAQRRITDAAASPKPVEALVRRYRGYHPGDTDLAWTRLTPWRALLAAALDQPHDEIVGGSVHAARGNPSADLLAGWLGERLGITAERRNSRGPGITAARLRSRRGEVSIARPDGRFATFTRPAQPDRRVALYRRSTADLLVEELQRFDPDEPYEAALAEAAVIARGAETAGRKRP